MTYELAMAAAMRRFSACVRGDAPTTPSGRGCRLRRVGRAGRRNAIEASSAPLAAAALVRDIVTSPPATPTEALLPPFMKTGVEAAV